MKSGGWRMAWHKITCRRCGKKFRSTSPWAKLCGPCKRANKRASDRLHNGVGQGPKMHKKPAAPKKKPVAVAVRDTQKAQRLDREQHLLNMALDARLYKDCMSSPVRVIRPGDPEFEAIARDVTPLERIPEASTLPIVSMIGREFLPNCGFPLR